MSELRQNFEGYEAQKELEKTVVVKGIQTDFESAGYDVVEVNSDKPWGAYLRITNDQADDFVADFFPSLTPDQARMGIEGVELSPKILIVSPAQRLSWQYHNNRAERWVFLTDGMYFKSLTDKQGEVRAVAAGEEYNFYRASDTGLRL